MNILLYCAIPLSQYRSAPRLGISIRWSVGLSIQSADEQNWDSTYWKALWLYKFLVFPVLRTNKRNTLTSLIFPISPEWIRFCISCVIGKNLVHTAVLLYYLTLNIRRKYKHNELFNMNVTFLLLPSIKKSFFREQYQQVRSSIKSTLSTNSQIL